MFEAVINGSFGRLSKFLAFSLLLLISGSEGTGGLGFGFEKLGLSLGLNFWVFRFWGLKFWVFRFWGFEGFWFGAGFGFCWGFLGFRKSTSLKPEEFEGGREVERPREEAKEAMSVLRCSMLLFEGLLDFFVSAIAGCGR